MSRPCIMARMSNDQPRGSLRDQQADLTRDLIIRAFQGLLQNDHPDAITYPQVAEAAGVSLRTVYRYFPTRAELLQNAATWLRRVHGRSALGRPAYGAGPGRRRARDGPPLRRAHERLPCAVRRTRSRSPATRAVATAVAEVPGKLPEDEVRRAEAVLACIRSGRAWLVLHDQYGLGGDEIVGRARLGRDHAARGRAPPQRRSGLSARRGHERRRRAAHPPGG